MGQRSDLERGIHGRRKVEKTKRNGITIEPVPQPPTEHAVASNSSEERSTTHENTRADYRNNTRVGSRNKAVHQKRIGRLRKASTAAAAAGART